MTFKIVLASLLLSPLGVSGQIMNALEKRYLEPFRWVDYEHPMTGNEKVERLSILPKGDTLQFINYYDEDLYPLDTAGLHYLDLDSDGDLDLIYHAMSGNMGRTSSKFYFQDKGFFILKGVANGRIYHINIDPHLEIFTYEHPCCDSYTNSIRTYTYDGIITCASNVVYIALEYGGLKGLPDLQSNQKKIVNSANLFISPNDLRNGGYFRSRTKEIHSKLRTGEFVMCGIIPNGTRAGILDSTIVNGESWHLIITDAIPKPDSSLYENWQTRHISKSRYLGWTNAFGLSNQH